MNKVILILMILIINISCKGEKGDLRSGVKDDLYSIIKNFIDENELKASNNTTIDEHNIYLVVFNKELNENHIKMTLIENTYYISNADGFFNYNDNVIAFYNIDEVKDYNLINKSYFLNAIDNSFPNDKSDIVEEIYDPIEKKFKITDNKIIELDLHYKTEH